MPYTTTSPFEGSISPAVVISTSIVALVSGFLLGVYSIRGYLVSPDLKAEREHYWKDPVESEESDIDEDDTILDHAPNWANGEDADRRQGLRAAAAAASKTTSAAKPAEQPKKIKEECKLVLVVRTDLGMTKGLFPPLFPSQPRCSELTSVRQQVKSPPNAATRRSRATRRSSRLRKRATRAPRRSCGSGSRSGRPRSRCRPRARRRCSS